MARLAKSANQTTSRSYLQALVTAAAVIVALYFGRKLLVPLAVSILFSFLLSTPLLWLERHRVPRVAAVSMVLLLGMSVGAGLTWLLVNEFSGILRDWPRYQENISRKIEAIKGAPGEGIQNLERTFAELKQDLSSSNTQAQGEPTDKPVPVKIVNGSSFLSSLGFAGPSLAEFLVELFAVFVLTMFILLNREQLRNRVFRLFGEGHLVLVTTTVDEAASRVSRFLLSQLSVNGCFGLALFIGLYFIGVPYAPLWGVLVLVFRFVPYAGTLISGFCPFLLSLAAFDGWQKPIEVLALYAGIELTVSSVIEPWVYANRAGITSVAYLLSAAFWTLLWGPIGLVLSTPLTVCLVVMGRHLPPLEFLYVLLGDEPALSEEVRFYQRMLAEDEDETAHLLDTATKANPLVQVYDKLVIPALSMAEQDRHEGRLSDQRAGIIYDVTSEVIEIAGERHPGPAAEMKYDHIVCVPTRDQADEIVACMLAQLLRQSGGDAEVRHEVKSGDGLVVLSALPPFAILHARTMCRRIRSNHPDTRIAIGVWGSDMSAEVIQERLGAASPDWVVTTLEQAMNLLTVAPKPEVAEHAATTG